MAANIGGKVVDRAVAVNESEVLDEGEDVTVEEEVKASGSRKDKKKKTKGITGFVKSVFKDAK